MESAKASPHHPEPRSRWRLVIFSALVLLVLTQAQPLVTLSMGGIAGSFGLRPVSNRCLGIRIAPNPTIDRFPEADFDFDFVLFHFQYTVHRGYYDTGRQFCLGQDIWVGD